MGCELARSRRSGGGPFLHHLLLAWRNVEADVSLRYEPLEALEMLWLEIVECLMQFVCLLVFSHVLRVAPLATLLNFFPCKTTLHVIGRCTTVSQPV